MKFFSFLQYVIICILFLTSCEKQSDTIYKRLFYEDFETNSALSNWKIVGSAYLCTSVAANIGGEYSLHLKGYNIHDPINGTWTVYDGFAQTAITNQVGNKILNLSTYDLNVLGNPEASLALYQVRGSNIISTHKINLLSDLSGDWQKTILIDTFNLIQTDTIFIKLSVHGYNEVLFDNIELKEIVDKNL